MLALAPRASDLPAPTLRLTGGGPGAEHPLPPGSDLVLGRSPQCDVVLDHAAVSRMHARVFARGGEVYLEDLGAANGTFVDGRQVFGTVRLRDGQTVELGRGPEGEPVLLQLEDPGERFLREMGLAPADAEGEPDAPGGEGDAEDATLAAPEPAEEESAPPPAPGRPWFLSPLPLAGAAAALLLLGVAVWGLLALLRPAPVPWRWVRVSPGEVAAGTRLVLQSPEIRPLPGLAVTLAGRAVPGFEAVPGRLSFVVPDLRQANAGIYPLLLAVRLRETDAFRGEVSYLVAPRIDGVSPSSARPGEVVTLHGASLAGPAGAVVVRIGGAEARVLEARPALLRAEVPPYAGPERTTMPVEVEAGGLRAVAPAPLAVEPKPAAVEKPPAPAPAKASADLPEGATFELENVFFPKDGYAARLELDLERRGSALAGTARLRFEKKGMEWSLPEVWVEGSLRGGEIALAGSFANPVGPLRLAGSFDGERWSGRFRGALVRGEGRWRAAERKTEDWP